ncbi:hypothetical protein [Nocardia neocaledoniensis]|uniref:hypothetical protein n=1 Tax=Nocardia neocaledoniensis TaxID=236511 RepID=UPI002458F8A5|nr:hypothetical protein [Nocardia neocaledoniensis]
MTTPDEPGEYRPRHAKPEDERRAEPERPSTSYSLRDEPTADASRAERSTQPGRPEVAYRGLPPDVGSTGGETDKQPWSTAGFVLAVIGLLLFPIIFGALGIACGLYGHTRGERLGYWSAVAALTALLAGLAIRVFFFDADLIPAQN